MGRTWVGDEIRVKKRAVQVAVLLTGWTTCQATLAQAQPGHKQGNFAEACPKLEESRRLDSQVGTMLNLALCYESLGKTATACTTWKDAAVAAEHKGQPERREFARERAELLCPRVPRATFEVAPQLGHDRIELTLNDAPLPRSQWGVPVPLDPGEYELKAAVGGLPSWSAKFHVDEQQTSSVTVPVLSRVSPPPGEESAMVALSNGRPNWSKTAGWVTGGAGLAFLGVGSAFGIAAIVNENESNADRNCVSNTCNATGASARARAKDDAKIADVAFAVGAGVLAASVVLWIVGSRDPAPGSAVFVRPSFAQSGWAVAVGEAWQ
jgi:hypothetical protein